MDRFNTEPESSQDAVEEAATSLALRYDLISRFTSFVAVDRVIRNADGRSRRVQVPLPLPRGVKDAPPPGRYVASASLSTDQFVPGDPEVQIDAPPDAVRVTLVFPTGEVKACTRDPRTDKWIASFLIPQHTPDGIYTIQVLITLGDGRQLWRRIRYQVDGTAPKVDLGLSPGRVSPGASVELRAVPRTLGQGLPTLNGDIGDPTFAARVIQEVKSAVALLPDGRRVELTMQRDGSYGAVFSAPERPGRYQVVVVVRDHARNKLRRVLRLVVGD
jgi:Ca-activated chloride channel family protein